MRIAAVLAAVMTSLLVVGGTQFPAHADGPCYEVTYKDPKTGEVKIKIVCPEDPGTGGGNTGTGKVKCFYQGEQVPCEISGARWNSANNCWVSIANPQQPPPGSKKDEDGDWYYCRLPPPYITPAGGPAQVWIEGPPTSFVNPGELAARAVAAMDLEPVGIGIVPEPGPDRMGLIGLPVWMWVANLAPNTYGPITRSASDGGVTVTATATVSGVVWDMGDGSDPIQCDEGTPYADHFGKQDSPSCGYRYELISAGQPGGAYTVTASSHWVVGWAGGGMTGTIELDLSSSEDVRVGEAQVLTQ